MEKLDSNFIPGAFDVICSRGKAAYHHQGNRSFRATLEHHLSSYANARSKQEKTEIVSLIYNAIQEATPDGGFIRKNDKGEWCRVPIHIAREKVGQGFRDLLHTEYRSSTKAKIKRRRERLYPPTKPPEDDEEEKGRTCSKELADSGTGKPPFVGRGEISKSFSYDSDPLPIIEQEGHQNDRRGQEMNLLSQCSFSFVAEGERKAQGTSVPPPPGHDRHSGHHDEEAPAHCGGGEGYGHHDRQSKRTVVSGPPPSNFPPPPQHHRHEVEPQSDHSAGTSVPAAAAATTGPPRLAPEHHYDNSDFRPHPQSHDMVDDYRTSACPSHPTSPFPTFPTPYPYYQQQNAADYYWRRGRTTFPLTQSPSGGIRGIRRPAPSSDDDHGRWRREGSYRFYRHHHHW